MKRVAILMTVHDRKAKTLACLAACQAQAETFKAEGKYSFTVYVTDDGSTDGTSDAIAESYPDTVVIRGDGNLFWNRGMRAAWLEAVKASPDFYIWLNDDTVLYDGAISVLLENSAFLGHKAIVVGTADDSSGQISYGGRSISGKIVEPDPVIPVACDTFNGNLVLVPKAVYECLGTMDPRYTHSFGDYDYGVRAEKAGVTVVVAPGVLARCDRNPGPPAWRDAGLSLKERYRALRSPKGRQPEEQFLYDMRSKNFFWAIGHFVVLNVKVLFPTRKGSNAVKRKRPASLPAFLSSSEVSCGGDSDLNCTHHLSSGVSAERDE